MASFLLDIDLDRFRVRGTPDPHEASGLIVALAGHISPASEESDWPERLAAAYVRHGEHLSRELLGQYAAVIVDPRRRRVLLVQDSLGVRPLFYALDGARLLVSSDLEPLVSLRGSHELDEAYFASMLARGGRAPLLTPFAGVDRLALGASLLVTRTERRALRPWRPTAVRWDGAMQDASARLRELLDDAVVSMLPRNGRTACELSGGLDSTTVLAVAHRRGSAVEALTVVSGSGLAGDDELWASHVIDELKIPWHRLDFDQFAPFSRLPTEFAGEPGDEIRVALQAAYAELVERERFDVVLTGMGGDATFGSSDVPPFHVADLLTAGRLRAAVEAASLWGEARGGDRAWMHWFIEFGLRPAWRHAWRRRVEAAPMRAPAWLGRRLVERHALDRLANRPSSPRVSLPGRQYLWDGIYDMASALGSAFHRRLTADMRHPLLHRPLVEFMLNLPSAMRHAPEGDRVLQREALAGLLPSRVLRRRTKSTSQPLRERALIDADMWRSMLLERPRLVSRGWIEADAWREAVDRARFGVLDQGQHLEAAMMCECWLQSIERHPPASASSAQRASCATARPSAAGGTTAKL